MTLAPALCDSLPGTKFCSIALTLLLSLLTQVRLGAQPSGVSVTPSSGTGLTQTFTFVYSDTGGYASLAWTQVLFSSTLNGFNACYVFYDQGSNAISLDDDNNNWSNSAALGSGGTLQNSQCSVNATNSSASGSGNNLTLNLAITFFPSFAGAKNTYMLAGESNGTTSQWLTAGAWTLGSPPTPSVISSTPSSGTGWTQTFSLVYADTAGWANLAWGQVLFDTSLQSGANACYVGYDRAGNWVALVNDAGTAWTPTVVLGTSNSISNSQCTINAAGSSRSGSGNNMTLNLAITFSSSFAGPKTIYMAAGDSGSYTDWQTMGTWTLPAVMAPTFSPVPDRYTSAQTVTISTTTSGASIRYTTSPVTPWATGSAPTCTTGTLYTGPISVTSPLQFRAIACATGMADSSITNGSYTIAVADPTFTPVTGTYTGTQSVTISTTTSGASIRYTTDGSIPNWFFGSLYSGPISVTGTTTILAFAYMPGFGSPGPAPSFVTPATYTMGSVGFPTFSPPDGGTGYYTGTQTVTIRTGTAGASIRYTVDGSTPTSTTGTPYSGPFPVAVSTIVKAIAFADNLIDSPVRTSNYNIAVVPPTFSPPAGTYTSPQTVTISTITSGASIRYTTDGSGPTTTTGTLYTTPIPVTTTQIVRAIVYATGMVDNAAYALYSIPVATPTFSPAGGTYTGTQNVTLSTTTAGASIRYTTDGSTPTSTTGNVYSSAITVSATTTVKAIAYASGNPDSAVASATFTITPATATPTLSPAAGTYTSAQTVTISTTTSGASIRYTTDGSTPTSTTGNVYSSAITVSATTTVKAIAYASGYTDSAVASATFAIQSQVATPTFNPGAGTYTSTQTVTISTATSGASTRYTTDGSTPSSTVGTLYTAPVSVSSSETINAISYKTGMTDSAVASATYTISPPPVSTPTFSPGAGTYTTTQTVTISTTTSGASIRYTTDGSTPSATTGTLYSGAITVSATATIKAIAYTTGTAGSAVAAAAYNIVAPPSITNLTPTSGAAGVPVTISGSGFGATRGAGTVWLGSTLGAVMSWSDTQIVATVALNSTSGSAQVRQNGVWSNAVPFNVRTATISSVAPPSGVPGTQMTITGSGFGATQGSGQVWLGTANGLVQSWSDTQIVALVASSSTSGTVQVLQGGVVSNTVPFTLNTLQITSVSPASASPGTSVTIIGTGFGASQGTGTVLLGSTNGQVVSWSDTQVAATVAPGSLTGVARIQQNGAWSNAVTFTVPGGTLTLVPNTLNLVVGDTRTIQARGSNGQSVTGLTWTSSNASVVSLSTNDPPILTAVAAGHVTITAGSASTDVTVSSGALPLGTVLWSSPGAFSKIIPAVPSPTGVADVFALQNDGTLQAITSDGITAWTADVSHSSGWVLADFRGGLVAVSGPGSRTYRLLATTITTFDGLTGQPYPLYVITNPDLSGLWSVAVHPDGTIFAHFNTVETSGAAHSTVVGIDPTTGAQKFSISLPNLRDASDIIVAGDGYAYMPYAVEANGAVHLKVLRVSSSGAYDQFAVFDWNLPYHYLFTFLGWNTLINSADDGVVLSWWDTITLGQSSPAPHWTRISSAGMSDSSGPVIAGQEQVPISPMLQHEDGSFVGVALVGDKWASYNQLVPYMVGVGPTGSVLWSVANEQPQTATEDGGIIGKSGIIYNQNGSATGQTNMATESWRGNMYQQGSVQQILAAIIRKAKSLWAQVGGNPSGNNSAGRPWYFNLVWKNNCATWPWPCGFTLYPENPQDLPNLAIDATSQAVAIKSAALDAFKKAFDKYPVTTVNVFEGTANTGDHRVNVHDGYAGARGEGGKIGDCGVSTGQVPSYDSKVYYRAHMEYAQWALPIIITTSAGVQGALSNSALMKAIGVGIGNDAAHEIAHQFLSSGYGMDDNSLNTYNGADCKGASARWIYGFGPIQWGNVTDNALKNSLKTGWH
jgi:hypothetical protein